jgi:hypothetical protein
MTMVYLYDFAGLPAPWSESISTEQATLHTEKGKNNINETALPALVLYTNR